MKLGTLSHSSRLRSWVVCTGWEMKGLVFGSPGYSVTKCGADSCWNLSSQDHFLPLTDLFCCLACNVEADDKMSRFGRIGNVNAMSWSCDLNFTRVSVCVRLHWDEVICRKQVSNCLSYSCHLQKETWKFNIIHGVQWLSYLYGVNMVLQST